MFTLYVGVTLSLESTLILLPSTESEASAELSSLLLALASSMAAQELRSSLEEQWMAVDARILGLHLPRLLPLSQEPFDLLRLFVVCLVTF